MEAPSLQVWLICAYSLVLLAVAWGFDRLSMRSADRSAQWRTGNFVYHDDQDAWKCHEDQWLWPASFDPDKRVIRYQGQHAICGRCPVKDACSPTPGPREITKPVDPWPHSESGRFHRGMALVVAVVGLLLPLGQLIMTHSVGDVMLLGTAGIAAAAACYGLARHLWNTPVSVPEHLTQEGSLRPEDTPTTLSVDDVVDRYATRWGIAGRKDA